MKMLRVKVIDNEEIYVNPSHIVFLRKGMYNGTKVILEGTTVINSVDPLAVVLLDLERLDYGKKEKE
nr:MAG TPA: Flagellar and Swarming motility protein [Herelleviridae sp.]